MCPVPSPCTICSLVPPISIPSRGSERCGRAEDGEGGGFILHFIRLWRLKLYCASFAPQVAAGILLQQMPLVWAILWCDSRTPHAPRGNLFLRPGLRAAAES